jgi:uncharacterized protein YndB with AHSA1/START domain
MAPSWRQAACSRFWKNLRGWLSPGNGKGEDTTLVTIFLRDVGGKTEMHFRHEGFTTEEDRNRHNDGWTGCFEKLEAFSATGKRQKGIALEGAA